MGKFLCIQSQYIINKKKRKLNANMYKYHVMRVMVMVCGSETNYDKTILVRLRFNISL